MVQSKKQEIFRKLNSNSGVGDSDVGKWVCLILLPQTNMHASNDNPNSVMCVHASCLCRVNLFLLIKHVITTFSVRWVFLIANNCLAGNAQPGTEIFNLPAVTSSSK